LVGPAGIGAINGSSVGNTTGSVVVANIPLTLLANGTAKGTYTSSLTVPSGTGIMRVQIQTLTDGGSPLYYEVDVAGTVSAILPKDIYPGGSVAAQGYAGWFAEGLMLYSNPTSSPIALTLTVGTQGSVQVCNLMAFSVFYISYGPYVSQ
jgi:hypothetical protein